MTTLAGADLLSSIHSDVGGKPIDWWLSLGMPGGYLGRHVIFYAGIAALCVAWLPRFFTILQVPA